MNYDDKKFVCTLDFAMEMIKGKWKVVIICHLNDSKGRFLELQRKLPGVSHKVLTEKLNELIEDRLVEKKVYQEMPPKVEYKLTKSGIELHKVLDSLQNWSDNYIKLYS